MGTLIRFYENSECVTCIYISKYDVIKETITWLISHDIGELRLIICGFRLFLRNKYHQYMRLYENNEKIQYNIDYTFDIGKHNGGLIVKFTDTHTNKYIIDTPQCIKYRLHI
jgi:hypothetical protein